MRTTINEKNYSGLGLGSVCIINEYKIKNSQRVGAGGRLKVFPLAGEVGVAPMQYGISGGVSKDYVEYYKEHMHSIKCTKFLIQFISMT